MIQIDHKNFTKGLLADYEKVWDEFIEQDNFASQIDQRFLGRSKYYSAIEKYLYGFPIPKILEIGCGTAIDINLIASRNPQWQCFGGDISQKSITIGLRVREIFGNSVKYLVCDTQTLPIQDDSFDLVFSQGLVEHFRNPESIVAEHSRILKNGGILIINVPQKFTGYTLMKTRRMRQRKWRLGWEAAFSCQDLKALAERLSLKEMEVFGYQYWQSWSEPTFVIRDLYEKLHRRNPLNGLAFFVLIKRAYDHLWQLLEKKWGHYFMQNIVIVLQKKAA